MRAHISVPGRSASRSTTSEDSCSRLDCNYRSFLRYDNRNCQVNREGAQQVRISDLEVVPVRIPAPRVPYRWREGLPTSRLEFEGGVLRVRTDAGVEGVAFASRPNAAHVLADLVDRHLRNEMIGQDPLMREWWWDRIWHLDRTEELPLYVFGLLDVALWDLAGRASDLPSWKVMGGFRAELPAYASTVTFDTIEQYLDVADQCLALGYPAIKLHAWGDPDRDIQLAYALREHVGQAYPLMYDGSAAFDLPDAIRVGRALTDANYLWYEEPIREFSVTAYKMLGESVGVPLLVAETSDGAHMNAADFVAAGCSNFGLRASARLRGGITGALRIGHLADAYRLRVEVHSPEVPSRHLCMALSNTTYYESLVTADPVNRDPVVGSDGMLRAPTEPGIALPASIELPSDLQAYQEGAAVANGIPAALAAGGTLR
ncbi:enolase C-terminal domain-like protein [Actinopolymorpha sp. B9G3]|uniref:enolase C-terminal domain-like protein n=1 Tax=Actinopolymorpha sp. B9G3 TaxID=3158970 RepID=UPI0032D94C03